MTARIVKTCTVVCGRGSVVEVSQGQFEALGDCAVPVERKEEPEGGKPARAGKKKG